MDKYIKDRNELRDKNKLLHNEIYDRNIKIKENNKKIYKLDKYINENCDHKFIKKELKGIFRVIYNVPSGTTYELVCEKCGYSKYP